MNQTRPTATPPRDLQTALLIDKVMVTNGFKWRQKEATMLEAYRAHVRHRND